MAKTSDGSAVVEAGEAAVQRRAPKRPSSLSLSGAMMRGATAKTRTILDRQLYASAFWKQVLAGPAPDRLLAMPRSHFRKSIAEAELMMKGRYRLIGGEGVTRDGSPFFIEPPSELWLESLHSFEWLRHLEAAGGEPTQAHVRQLIAHWIRTYGQQWNDIPWRPHVIARRLMTWSSFGRLILVNAEILFRSRALWSMARQARHLEKTVTKAPPGLPRMTAVIGLVVSGVALPDGERRLAKGLHLLAEELSTQILPDGGHISRNPETLLVIMSDLLSLLDGMRQREIAVPATIRRALDRMTPMVRFMQMGDNRLAAFNGGSEAVDGWPAALLTYDETRGRALPHAPQSGYQRLAAGEMIVVVDAGAGPPAEYSLDAHAGCLSFEMSIGAQRLVVNCGTIKTKGPEWAQATRATAAHSTLTIADTSSAHVVANKTALRLLGARLLPGPTHVDVKRQDVEDGVWLNATHDGYVKPFGYTHERSLFLSNDGREFRGEDFVVAQARKARAGLPVNVQFHLHPDVGVTLDDDAMGASLALPGGERWRFEADGAKIEVAESVHCGAGDNSRPTSQLVISTATTNETAGVKWRFKFAPVEKFPAAEG